MKEPSREDRTDSARRRVPFVADAGPLIALARVRRLGLLRRLFDRGIVPPAVHREMAVDSGRPGANVIGRAFDAGWLRLATLAEDARVAEFSALLDAGEAEAIALCLRAPVRFLLIDEARGREVARRAGIPVVGVAGVLPAAKANGQLSAVGPVLEDLVGVGYRLSRGLLGEVRRRAGE